MGDISHKRTMIESVLLDASMNNREVVLVTSAGVITGMCANSNDASRYSEIAKSSSNIFWRINDTELEIDINDNVGFITLMPATLQQGNWNQTFDQLVVFFDDIVGITVAMN